MSYQTQLAKAFAQGILDYVEPWQFAEIKRRNSTPEYLGDICASHDFCDANMIMFFAFKEVLGREPNIGTDEEADCEIWSGAWNIAKAQMLSEERNAR